MLVASSESTAQLGLTDDDLKFIVKEHRFRSHNFGTPVRTRAMTSFVGFAPNEAIGCFSSSMTNMRLSIFGRVLSKEVGDKRIPLLKTLPLPGHELPLLDYAKCLAKLMPSTTPLEPQQFAEKYGGRKRKEYLRAALSLRNASLNRRDANIKLFLKHEKDVRSLKPGQIPRCILPPDVRYTVETGRFVHPMEKHIYASIDHLWGSEVVSKGKNYVGVATMLVDAWHDFRDPCSLDCDVSKFDQSNTAQVLQVLFTLLADSAGVDHDYLLKILSWTLETRVRGRTDDGCFEYRQRGTLSSGMCYTSLAGVFVVTGIVWLYCRETGIRLRLVDAGDDMTVVFDRVDLSVVSQGLVPYFKRFGFTLKVGEPNYNLEGIEFCQCHPMIVNGRYQMVRNARAAAVKDYVSIDHLRTPLHAAAWLESVGRCGLASQGGVPVCTARYNQMVRSSIAIRSELRLRPRQEKRYRNLVSRMSEVDGSFKWYGGGMQNDPTVEDAARFGYYKAFGIAPHVQRALESELDSENLNFDLSEVVRPQMAWDCSEEL